MSRATCTVHVAHEVDNDGSIGYTASKPPTVASMLGPSPDGGRLKFIPRLKISGYHKRIASFRLVRVTSASSTKFTVSDQLRTVTLITRPPCEYPSCSIRVNGQGPATHETRASRNSFPSPASRDAPPIAAFHLPSGEHGEWPPQGTFPVFATSKLLRALPVSTLVRWLSV